ncbi:unnamed protein product [Rhizophagus irregularis]|nr:unnamed protein product [Rhizophagus irregularis]
MGDFTQSDTSQPQFTIVDKKFSKRLDNFDSSSFKLYCMYIEPMMGDFTQSDTSQPQFTIVDSLGNNLTPIVINGTTCFDIMESRGYNIQLERSSFLHAKNTDPTMYSSFFDRAIMRGEKRKISNKSMQEVNVNWILNSQEPTPIAFFHLTLRN